MSALTSIKLPTFLPFENFDSASLGARRRL